MIRPRPDRPGAEEVEVRAPEQAVPAMAVTTKRLTPLVRDARCRIEHGRSGGASAPALADGEPVAHVERDDDPSRPVGRDEPADEGRVARGPPCPGRPGRSRRPSAASTAPPSGDHPRPRRCIRSGHARRRCPPRRLYSAERPSAHRRGRRRGASVAPAAAKAACDPDRVVGVRRLAVEVALRAGGRRDHHAGRSPGRRSNRPCSPRRSCLTVTMPPL